MRQFSTSGGAALKAFGRWPAFDELTEHLEKLGSPTRICLLLLAVSAIKVTCYYYVLSSLAGVALGAKRYSQTQFPFRLLLVICAFVPVLLPFGPCTSQLFRQDHGHHHHKHHGGHHGEGPAEPEKGKLEAEDGPHSEKEAEGRADTGADALTH